MLIFEFAKGDYEIQFIMFLLNHSLSGTQGSVSAEVYPSCLRAKSTSSRGHTERPTTIATDIHTHQKLK